MYYRYLIAVVEIKFYMSHLNTVELYPRGPLRHTDASLF